MNDLMNFIRISLLHVVSSYVAMLYVNLSETFFKYRAVSALSNKCKY